MTEQRHTRVKRVEAVGAQKARTIQAEFDVSGNITNVWALTSGEARQLGLQLLDVAGISDGMCESFREGWHSESVKWQRVRAGLRSMVRS